jgi:membrane associated rhomboid family serine protease
MSPPEQTAGPHDQRPPEDLAEAGVYSTSEQGDAHGLVVLAMGLSYCLSPCDGFFRLLVEPGQVEAVRIQLAKFDRESIGWPPLPVLPESPMAQLALGGPVVWALVVAAVYWGQCEWPDRLEARGALDSQAVFGAGQWWRPFTALFLHAEPAHLWSNLLPGVLVFAVVCASFGRLRGWLLLGLASVAANTAVAGLSFPREYRSLGASTAVFAGLGLLTGRAACLAWRSVQSRRWRAVFVPLGAGGTLLALHGVGGPRTDVAAHLAGFAMGLLVGAFSSLGGARAARSAPASGWGPK